MDQQVSNRITVPLKHVVVGSYNPRHRIDDAALADLAESIKAQGILQPPRVRPIVIDEQPRYELVFGQRRLLAARLAFGDDGQIDVDCRSMSDAEAIAAATAENIDREDMTAPEEAEAAARVLAMHENDREQAAKRLGWSRTKLDARLKLMACAQPVRDALCDDKVPLGIAELLAGLPKAKQGDQLQAYLDAVKKPTEAEFRTALMSLTKALDGAIFDTTACASCHYNSAQQRAMFGTYSDGHCLNAQCYDEKTEVELQARVEKLKPDYPKVVIARPGENYTIVRLVADGAGGVGAEQAQACKACANYGAAVSAIPDKLGRVVTGLCYSPSCNTEKVAAYAASIAPPAAPAQDQPDSPAQGSPAGGASSTGKTAGATPKVPPKPTITLSSAVVEFRDTLYREVLAREILASSERGVAFLMALGATRHLRDIPAERVSQVLTRGQPDLKESELSTVTSAFKAALKGDAEKLQRAALVVSSFAAADLPQTDLLDMVDAVQPDWAKYFTLDATFLKILTKSEIEVVAKELGMDKALGSKFAKLWSGKKDEIISALTSIDGFAYEGALPKMLTPRFGRNKR